MTHSPHEILAAFRKTQAAIKSDKGVLAKLVGARVKQLRRDAKLNQSDLGMMCGLSRTSITNLEAGKQNIGITVLLRIANALNVNPGALLPTLDELRAGLEKGKS